jgi:hypothetical protein
MKTIGIVVLCIGLLMTVYTGFKYFTTEKIVDLGSLEITKEKEHSMNWQPYVGLGVMVVGGALLAISRKQSFSF